MTGSLLLWIFLALTIFWGVGLYNRLMRIRARGRDALGSVEKHLKGYATVTHAYLMEMGVPEEAIKGVAGEQGLPHGWANLLGTLHALDVACKTARTTPMAIAPMEAVGRGLQNVAHAWAELSSAPADLAGPAVPDTLLKEWEDITQKVQIARGGYNQIVARYNESIGQFPARLVVGAMGFQPAGTL